MPRLRGTMNRKRKYLKDGYYIKPDNPCPVCRGEICRSLLHIWREFFLCTGYQAEKKRSK